MGETAVKYLAALLHPFSKQAEGATVPEPYAVNTTTRKCHAPIVLTSSAGGGLDFSIQPHLVSSFVQYTGSSTGANSYSPGGAPPAGLVVRGVVTPASLAALYTNYRIVAMGARIKTNIDFTKSGGRVYGAVLPATYEQPLVFDTGTTLANSAAMYDIPFDGAVNAISTSILNLPRGFQFTVAELMSEGGVEITFPIAGAASTSFLEGTQQSYEQKLGANVPGWTGIAAAGLGYGSSAGFTQLVVRAEGLEPSKDVLTVELIYHVEGTESVTSSGAATSSIVPSMPNRPPPSGPHEVHQCHAHLSQVPVVRYVSEKLMLEARAFGGAMRSQMAKRAIDGAERVLGTAARNVVKGMIM